MIVVADARRQFGGCYVTVPTPFRDDDLSVDLPRHFAGTWNT